MDDSIILNLPMYIDQKNKQSLQMTPFEWIGIFSLFFEVTGDWYFRVSCSLLWGFHHGLCHGAACEVFSLIIGEGQTDYLYFICTNCYITTKINLQGMIFITQLDTLYDTSCFYWDTCNCIRF
jgi:hypothetical protein